MSKKITHLSLIILIMMFPGSLLLAQTANVTGKVLDENKQPMGFVTVQLEGTAKGAVADVNGVYKIATVAAGNYNLVSSFVGYKKFTVAITVGSTDLTIDINMEKETNELKSVVVIGYGSIQKKDLTGSITSISSKDFLKGNISSPEQLVMGKVPGLQITPPSGAPGAGSQIRIRGTSSLKASNDPLIVIDGVPVDNGNVAFSANALNMINPNDIETFTILKDASATAIYGSRASNGVIIITTKKGTAGKFKLQFSTNNSVAQIVKYVDMLTAAEFRKVIEDHAAANPGTASNKQLFLLDSAYTPLKKKYAPGGSGTDWQKEIFRLGFTTDDNISLSGGIKKLPYRLTLGYYKQNGILKETSMSRYSTALNLHPSFLKNYLVVDVNVKLTHTENNFSNDGALGSAINMDPTKPVESGMENYGGYFEWLEPSTGLPNANATKNPVGLLMERDNKGSANRLLGNIAFDYKLHFLPDLHANLNLGTDLQRGMGTNLVPNFAASNFNVDSNKRGYYKHSENKKRNKLMDFSLNYVKEIKTIKSRIDITGGYSYQDWYFEEPNFYTYYTKKGTDQADTVAQSKAVFPNKQQNTLISFYGRLNYAFHDKYLLTVTLRDDGSSRFSPDTRWGTFPSAAFAWRISDESFLKNSKILSNLKLRLGYGITGQQEGIGNYTYLATYDQGQNTAQYQFDNSYYYVLRPNGYDANIKWETTKTYNGGLDFGFHNNRLFGSIDIYHKYTSDLLSTIPVPAGSNFTNQILTNVGNMENKGYEISLGIVPYDTKNFYWELNVNATHNVNELTKLTKVEDPTSPGILTGGINGGVGNSVQIHSVGYALNTFYLYHQLYDENGKPIEAGTKKADGTLYTDVEAYQDQNGDTVINSKDLIRTHNPSPKWYMGFNTRVNLKNWSFGISLRGNFGGYVYNNVNSSLGFYGVAVSDAANKNFLSNLTKDYNNTNFQKAQYLSDYYLEKASFVKIDNINIGYDFKNIIAKKVALKASITVQNVATFSKYSGIDPEIANGIGYTLYPRPRFYSLNLSFQL